MKVLEHTKAIRAYCDYLDRHIKNVRRAWDEIAQACASMRFVYDDYVFWSIESMVVDHDLSKVSAAEFIPYQRRFFPLEGEEPDRDGFAPAWENHKASNPHHWEHWSVRDYSNPYEAECHCVCMVIDWTAMAYEFGDTAESYYRKNADKIPIPDWSVRFIEEIFELTRDLDVPCGGMA